MMTALGLMSGTSMDGIDAALLRTDGETVMELGPATTIEYTAVERNVVRRATEAAMTFRQRPNDIPPEIANAENLVTSAHARVVEKLLDSNYAGDWDVEIIGFHGQTILHRPEEGWTWQIGNGRALAKSLGVTVVDDFRSADMSAGGQGAPLAPLYHQALVRSLEPRDTEPIAVVNIGGIANVTWVSPDGRLLAFDIGPGNGLLDDWMSERCGQPSDWNGETAARGRASDSALEIMKQHEYLSALPPKSLDRHDFTLEAVNGLSAEDGAATLTRFTAHAIAASQAYFPAPVGRWLVCGGGRHNPALMAELAAIIRAPLTAVEDVGWRGDTIEAEAFGLLAVASMRGLPLSFPTTTGVPQPMGGGQVHYFER